MKIAFMIATIGFSYFMHAQTHEHTHTQPMRYIKPSLEDHQPCAFSLPDHGESIMSIDLLPKRDFLRPSHTPRNPITSPNHPNVSKYSPLNTPSSSSSTLPANSRCPDFHTLSGEELVQALLEIHQGCLSRVFYPSRSRLTALFSEQKMILVLRKFAELSTIYQGNNQDNIVNFVKYIWAAYLNDSSYPKVLNVHLTENVTEELRLALDEFVNNTYFSSVSSVHTALLADIVQIILLSKQSKRYSHKLTYLLDHFSISHPHAKDIHTVIMSILELYRLSHASSGREGTYPEFINDILKGNTEPLAALIRFSKREDLHDDEFFSDLLYQSVKNVGTFLQYEDHLVIYDMALARMEEILEQYPMESRKWELRFLASHAIYYWGSKNTRGPSCATYNVCSYQSEWRRFLFRPEYSYTCQATDTIILYFMRDIPLAVKEEACADLIDTDNFFHETLNTQKIPVTTQHQPTTDTVEGYIFSSGNHYRTYGELFDIGTNNAGLFISRGYHRNPRFFVYEIGDVNNLIIANFRHEFVHYLDARYNRTEIKTFEAPSMVVWWIEGIAEYIAHGTYYSAVFNQARYRSYKLSEVFPETPYDSIRTYYFGYLAINFFLKKFSHIVDGILESLRDGWIGWTDQFIEIGTSLDDDFQTWLDDSLNNPAEGYCYGEPESEEKNGYIERILLAGQTVNNYPLHSGYVLNKYNPITVHSGSSYPFEIMLSAQSQTNNHVYRVEAWVDWNDDQVLSDDEQQFSTQVTLSDPDSSHTLSQILTVPTNGRARTEVGDYIRLRLRITNMDESTSPDVCSNYQDGETEDYVLQVFSRSSGASSYIQSSLQEGPSLVKIHQPSRSIQLSEFFYTDDNRVLTYEVRSSDSNTVSAVVTGDQLVINKIASGIRTKPVTIFVTAIDTSNYQVTREIMVVFEPYTIPVFLSASDRRESIVRITNRSHQGGVVNITAKDESGQVKEPVSLSIEALETIHLSSRDLENGNEGKGLSGVLGAGNGNWHLTLDSDLDFHATSYVQMSDGFLMSMNESVDFTFNNDNNEYTYFAPIFNPASSRNQKSLLTLSNHNMNQASAVEISGIDDSGNAGEESITFTLPAGATRTLNAVELETGEGEGLNGAFGDGRGKWHLAIRSSRSLDVTNVIENSTKYLSNMSKKPSLAQQYQGIGSQLVPLFLPLEERRQGLIRIVNRSPNSGEVVIKARDDSRRYGAISLSFRAGEVKYFDSSDLENGNERKGFPSEGFGAPQGMWRLKFESELDIQVLNYMRHNNGFLTSLYGTLPMKSKNTYEVHLFNPASNQNQRSFLRFFNNNLLDAEGAEIRITGIDDSGQHGETSFDFHLPPGAVKTVTALDLENGENTWSGYFGDGQGQWRLTIESSLPVDVMNLIEHSNGYLSNFSSP